MSFCKKPVSTLLFVFLAASFPLAAASATAPPSGILAPALEKLAPRLSAQAIQAGLTALERLRAGGVAVRSDVLTIIDYTKPSTEKRLWVFDLVHQSVLFEELTAHGRNSGDNRAVRFSNEPDSLMSSLGVFRTGETYIGKHGLSLRLEGLEKGINDHSLARGIVIHAADYVSQALAAARGRIGRSWGCPAVRPEVSRRLIETLRGGSLVVSYYPDPAWLRTSSLAGPLAAAPHSTN